MLRAPRLLGARGGQAAAAAAPTCRKQHQEVELAWSRWWGTRCDGDVPGQHPLLPQGLGNLCSHLQAGSQLGWAALPAGRPRAPTPPSP